MIKEKAYYEKQADEKDYFYFNLDKNNHCLAHFHKNNEILFVKSGKHKVGINGIERILTKGEIAFSSSYDIHYYNCDIESEVYILLFGSDFYNRFYREYNKRFGNFLTVQEKTTKQIFSLLFSFYNQKNELNKLMINGYIDLILGLMANNYELFPIVQDNNNIVVEILTYINDNYKTNITLDSVSKKFGYSKTYFSMLFNKYTDMHFRDYVNRLRISDIKNLLDNKKDNYNTVAEIAFNNGFDSLNTYYRAMKKFSK